MRERSVLAASGARARIAVEGAQDGGTVRVHVPEASPSTTPKDALRAKLQAAKGARGRK